MVCTVQVARPLFIFVEKKGENTHSVHVITKCRWKRVIVVEEEWTKKYIKLVLAPEVGQGIMPNTVGGSRAISCLKSNGNHETMTTDR